MNFVFKIKIVTRLQKIDLNKNVAVNSKLLGSGSIIKSHHNNSKNPLKIKCVHKND